LNYVLDNRYKSEDVIDKIDLSILEYTKRKEMNEKKITNLKSKLLEKNEMIIKKLEIENVKFTLYIFIMKKLVEIENKKPDKKSILLGGNKKTCKKYSKKRKTVKWKKKA